MNRFEHSSLLLLFAVLSCLASGLGLRAQERGEIGIAVGSTPPAVEIEDLEGAPVALATYIIDRPAVVEFWATWCENCAALQPHMDAAYERFGEEVAFVAVAVAVAQSRRSVSRHLEREPVPYPVLWDAGGKAVRSFLAPATSYVVVLDRSGSVAYTGIGPDQDIEAAIEKVLP